MATTPRQPDQLDMQIEMVTRALNRQFALAKQAVSYWEPQRPTVVIDIPNDQDRLYADEAMKR